MWSQFRRILFLEQIPAKPARRTLAESRQLKTRTRRSSIMAGGAPASLNGREPRREWGRDQRGTTVVLFAITLPIVLLTIGGALDYGYLFAQKGKLQDVSDAAAIAAAREMHVANTDPGELHAVVEAVVKAHLGKHAADVKIATLASADPMSVTVDLKQIMDGFLVSQFHGRELTAHSVVHVVGGTPLCVLALGELLPGAISLESQARLTGNECAVYSNSESFAGVISKGGAQLHAGFICSAGGALGGEDNYRPKPLTDCPPMEDPLAKRPAPEVGPCVATDLRIGVDKNTRVNHTTNTLKTGGETATELTPLTAKLDPSELQSADGMTSQHVTLTPGTYCGDLIVGGAATVDFQPGEYVLKDGQLHVTDFATVRGEQVGFYFHGGKSVFFFGPNTTVSLTAPTDGSLAGILFYENRDARPLRTFSILSDNARLLEGTIYLPQAYLFIDADQPIADKSAYTAIITRRLALYAGPNLVLNTDYDQTNVPVPPGIAYDRQLVLAE